MEKRIVGSLLVSFLLVLVCISFGSSWAAEKYPSRPIELICPYAPGGIADIITRAIAKALPKLVGVSVVSVNKPGGAGTIAANYLINSSPDGYTIMYGFDTHYINLLLGQATYKLEDVRIIAKFSDSNFVMAVAADSPWKTFQETIDYAKKNPGIVTFGSPPGGTANNILMELLKKEAKLNMVNVPFPGDAQIIPAILGKHISMGNLTLPGSKPLADAGKIRILFSFCSVADFGLDRSILDWPTLFKEPPPFISNGYVFAHPKTPEETVKVLEGALEKLMKDPEFIQEVKKLNVYASFIDGKTFTEKYLPQKMATLKGVLKDMGLIK